MEERRGGKRMEMEEMRGNGEMKDSEDEVLLTI